MLTWPTEIDCPQPSGYKLTPVDVTSRSPVASGSVRLRRRAVTAPTQLECTWVLDNEQVRLLEDFYEQALKMGSESFLMPVWFAGAFHAQTVVMQGPPEFTYQNIFQHSAVTKYVITDRLGTSLWKELTIADKDTTVDLAVLSSQFRISRVDFYIRTPANSDVSDLVTVGWASDPDALVTSLSIATAGHIPVKVGHANAGVSLNVLQDSSLPRTLQLVWDSLTADPTECDIVVVLPYKEA